MFRQTYSEKKFMQKRLLEIIRHDKLAFEARNKKPERPKRSRPSLKQKKILEQQLRKSENEKKAENKFKNIFEKIKSFLGADRE